MKLTNEQIQYVEDYLIQNKVKYVDLRMELLDHIVLAVEHKMTKGLSFDEAMLDTHKSFGNRTQVIDFNDPKMRFKTSIYGDNSGFKTLKEEKIAELNKEGDRLVLLMTKKLLLNLRFLVFYVLFGVVSFAIMKTSNKKLLALTMFGIVFLFLARMFYSWFKFSRKPKLLFAQHSGSLHFTFLSLINSVHIFDSLEPYVLTIFWALIMIEIPILISSYKVMRKKENEVEIYRKLLA